MKWLNMILKFSGRLFIGCMFAVCMVLGVVPIIPKRKEQFSIEIKMEHDETENEKAPSFIQSKRDD